MEKFTLEKAKQMKYPVYWETFYQISQIPRGTFHCKQIATFLSKKLKSYTTNKPEVDKANNVYVKIPATKGCGNWPSICLQGHMDIVWSKDKSSNHDFVRQPLELLIEDNRLMANKTTLGADDGISIASIFAVLESNRPHGPLEILITADEEYCAIGASKLRHDIVSSKYALNIDGEELDAITIGSSSCTCQDITFNFLREKVKGYSFLNYSIKNLKGGHSGFNIHLKRLNAIKWFFDITYKLLLHKEFDLRLVSINGGELMNAIPVQAEGEIAIKTQYLNEAKRLLKKLCDEYRFEYLQCCDPVFEENDKEDIEYDPIQKERSDEIIRCYTAMFNGVDVINPNTGYQETSTNLGVIQTKTNQITSNSYVRSLYENAADRIIDTVQAVVELAHGTVVYPQRLPAWSPIRDNNPLVDSYKEVYKKVIGNDNLKVVVSPGGLEGAWFLKTNSKLKYIVNCGPNIADVHTQNETLDIKSAIKSYEIIQELVSTIDKWGRESNKKSTK